MVINFNLTDSCMVNLANSDPLLGKVIKRIGDYSLELSEDYYLKLIKSIIGQQLSLKAKETIWHRVESICEEITPQTILSVKDTELRAAGISFAKISYIKGLSKEILNNRIDLENIELKHNQEILKILTGVKGIGRWTAEMFLIFSLGRLDVFSADDVSLRRAIKWLYGFNENPTKIEMIHISEKWNPYYSIASLYLWAAVDTGLINENPSTI